MKKDIVLHSDCPFLLMRMFTDLQMDGRFDDDLGWNSITVRKYEIGFLKIYANSKILFFSKDAGIIYTTITPLTKSNYLSTLKMILE